jgi:hypothetical protein
VGKSQRLKGANFERQTANKWRVLFPDAMRTGGWQASDYAVGDISGIGHFHAELKVGKAPRPIKALEQAVKTMPSGKIPIAICRKDRSFTLVCFYQKDFESLAAQYAEVSFLRGVEKIFHKVIRDSGHPDPFGTYEVADAGCPKGSIPLAYCQNKKVSIVCIEEENFLDFYGEMMERSNCNG